MTSSTSTVYFRSSDGVKLFGTLTTPNGAPTKLVLFVHGITSNRDEWGVFTRASEIFAKRGVASLRFDFRGHGESDLPSQEITLNGIENDIVAAHGVLASIAPEVPRFIIASSFGGGLAYHAASSTQTFTHAFLLAPVFDYAEDIKRSAPNWKSDIATQGTISYSTLRLSPDIVLEADNYRPIDENPRLPATIFHGTLDDDVPIESSQHLAATYSLFELVQVIGAGHVIASPGDLDMELQSSWAFVEDVLSKIVKQMLDGALER